MQIDLRMDVPDDVQRVLKRLSGDELRQAQVLALNDTGFYLRGAMMKEIGSVFDRVTPFIQRAPKVLKATPDNLSVTIAPTLDTRNLGSKGGKVGVDPQQVLQAQEFGGVRADKRSEIALRRIGVLPPGYQTAIPKEPFPGSDDGRGNMRGAFMRQLLSYLQAGASASDGKGYTSNMTPKKMASIHRGTKKTTARRYFVAGGRTTLQIEGGEKAVMKTGGAGRTKHLPKGIWAVVDGQLKPVLMFVRAAKYTPKLSMDRIVQKADGEAYLAKRLRYRIRQIAGE